MFNTTLHNFAKFSQVSLAQNQCGYFFLFFVTLLGVSAVNELLCLGGITHLILIGKH